MFVFVYSPYHLKLSFPHPVVILTTLGIRRHYHESSDCFEYPQKSPLKSSHPKKYLPNFSTPKNPRIEKLKPQKILRSSPSLEIRSTPPPPPQWGQFHVVFACRIFFVLAGYVFFFHIYFWFEMLQ